MTTPGATTSTATSNRPLQRRDILLEGDDELPPAYTPNPDVNQGETTVEYGPTRPFQPVPAARLSPGPSSHSSPRGGMLGSIWNQIAGQLQEMAISSSTPPPPGEGSLTPQPTGGSRSSYPGRQQQRSHAPPSGAPSHLNTGSERFLAPPRRRARASLSADPSRPTPSSEFARDFYAAGAIIPGNDVSNEFGSERGSGGGNLALPPVAGKPTTTPMPGHPYLHDNQLLVYPKGYECEKCHNIGYKLPSLKPCKRCWHKYGKPFTGPLVYSFREGTASTSTTTAAAASNFQRPLPNPTPPPIGRPRFNRNSCPPTLPNLTPQTTGLQPQSLSSNYRSPPPPPRFPGLLGSLAAIPNYHSNHMSFETHGRRSYLIERPARGLAPGVVYQAGDPKLGGRLCWKCDGRGTVSYMLIDREQCSVCGGIGRTFP